MPDEIVIAYIACADMTEARMIGRALVEERLAACVHLREHEAIYRWHGVVEQGPEVGVLAKTTEASWPGLQNRVRALHSYDLPCIMAWLARGTDEYLGWVQQSVG